MQRKGPLTTLTDALVERVAPALQEFSVHDAQVKGFSLRIQPSGAKSWTLRVTRAGKSQRVWIGDATHMKVELARKHAHALLSGLQPLSTMRSANRPKFREFAVLFVRKKRHVWRPSTTRANISRLRSVLLPAFSDMRMDSITQPDVARWFGEWSRVAPGGANASLNLLKSMFFKAIDWGHLPEGHKNPCRGIRKNRCRRIGQVISSDNLGALGLALDELRTTHPDAADCLMLMLHTGCRPGEIRNLKWSEVEKEWLELSESKVGPRKVPLPPAAVAILKRRKKRTPFVFPQKGSPSESVADTRVVWRCICAKHGLPTDLRLYDIRHTYVSRAIMDGESMAMAGALAGHRRIQTTAGYSHLEPGVLGASAQRIATEIAKRFDLGRIRPVQQVAADSAPSPPTIEAIVENEPEPTMSSPALAVPPPGRSFDDVMKDFDAVCVEARIFHSALKRAGAPSPSLHEVAKATGEWLRSSLEQARLVGHRTSTDGAMNEFVPDCLDVALPKTREDVFRAFEAMCVESYKDHLSGNGDSKTPSLVERFRATGGWLRRALAQADPE